MAFVHLHCHTEYSLLDGITRLKAMAQRAWELGMPACAITDHGYMYGCAQYYLEAQKAGSPDGRHGPEYGIKPILGCEVYFTPDSTLARDRKPELYHMILLAKNNTGYINLMNVVSEAATRGFYYKPRVTLEMLRSHADGLIATSACLAGIIPDALIVGDEARARQWAQTFCGLFAPGDFYIELQNQGITADNGMTQDELNRRLDKLARELGIKTVATNDFHYLKRTDAFTQDVMMCIGMGKKLDDPGRMRFKNDQFYMKTEEEMRAALGPLYGEACDTTLEIAEKCGATPPEAAGEKSGVYLDFDQIILPRYPLDPGQTNESQFRRDCEAGLARRFGADWKETRPDVVERFEYEYKVICDKGFAAYFLIVADYVRWAKEHGIGVGPGRGSAAGAIVAYALNITTLDPIENGLMFERFLSPERAEMPDIDMDFDDKGRLEVIEYVRSRYGADHVAHVITYSVLKAKQAVNDAARVLGFPVSLAQKLSKMISNAPDTTLAATMGKDDAHKEYFSPDFVQAYQEDPDAKQIIDTACAIEGLTRGEGIHASAVLICRDPVNEHVPTKLDTKGGVEITQYEGLMVADMGLLKMDFLGLRTLTVISKARENIKATCGIDIDPDEIPFDDPAIFDLMGTGHTAGVFQIESGGMTATIKSMKPTAYKQVVALIALYRPGPLGAGMVSDYVDRMNGRKPIVFYDDRLSDILNETYGTIVYQEQVMQISMRMSGFSAGESDSRIRKPVAKKKIKLLTNEIYTWEDGKEETTYDHWMNGAAAKGYSREVAQRIWDDVLEFASYAFNKSHSAGYAILVMQTAWLKAHYPREYMAAVLTSYTGKTEKIVHYIAACRFDGIEVLPPDINSSGNEFTPVAEGIRFGLAGIRGVGEEVSSLIVEERRVGGPYRDLFDFLERMESSKANRRVIESLIKAGAFDTTGYTRKQLCFLVNKDNPDNIIDAASKQQKNRAAGQLSMFDLFEDDEDMSGAYVRIDPDGVEWDTRTKLELEKEALGIYVSDHPLRPYEEVLAQERTYSIAQIDEETQEGTGRYLVPERKTFIWTGMVEDLQKKFTRNGDQMATFTLADMEAGITCVCFPKIYAKKGALLVPSTTPTDAAGTGQEAGTSDVFVKIHANLDRSDRGNQLLVSDIELLELKEVAPRTKILEIRVSSSLLNQNLIGQLAAVMRGYPGNDAAELYIEQTNGCLMRADIPLHVDASKEELSERIRELLGEKGHVEVV